MVAIKLFNEVELIELIVGLLAPVAVLERASCVNMSRRILFSFIASDDALCKHNLLRLLLSRKIQQTTWLLFYERSAIIISKSINLGFCDNFQEQIKFISTGR
jgi:hypothetical protein